MSSGAWTEACVKTGQWVRIVVGSTVPSEAAIHMLKHSREDSLRTTQSGSAVF